jgi:hypothetical protein
LIAACAAAGCAPVTAHREAFEKWRDAYAMGDFDTAYSLMSPAFKSDWVLRIFRPIRMGDRKDQIEYAPIAKRAIQRLEPPVFEELTNWLRVGREAFDANRPPAPLPQYLLEHAWVREVLRESFLESHPMVKHEFNAMEVSSAPPPEENMATIMIKNFVGSSEFYEMIRLEGAWLVNYHRTGPNP